jgi:hypothetical protein
LDDFAVAASNRIGVKIVVVVLSHNGYSLSWHEIYFVPPARAGIDDNFSGAVGENKFVTDYAGNFPRNGGAIAAPQLSNGSSS